MTPLFDIITTVIIEVYLQNYRFIGFIESVSQRELGKYTSRAEISSPNTLYFKGVKGAHLGFALFYSIDRPMSDKLL